MTPNRWKYDLVLVKPSLSPARHRERVKQVLDDMGIKGWELVGAPAIAAWTEVTLVFKRPA
jgi:hypothetical protein